MKRRKWTPKEKLMIVIEGLKGKTSLAQLCNRHQITQGMYYKWRDQLFKDGDKIFTHGGPDKAQQRLKSENQKLKNIIGELTIELKKTEYDDDGLL
jgi:transposase-like protein